MLFSDSFDLVIGILSARQNFKQRDIIRKTWLNHKAKYGVKHMFIIGEACKTPIEDRLDEYSCTRWNISLPDTKDNIEAVTVESCPAQNELLSSNHTLVNSLIFKVLHPIVITSIGLHTHVVLLNKTTPHPTSITVSLHPENDEDSVVTSATFTSPATLISKGDYRYKNTEKYILPKGFHGRLVSNYGVINGRRPPVHTPLATQSCPGQTTYAAIQILHPIDECSDSHDLRLPLMNFLYEIQDISSLSKHISKQSTRQLEWDALLQLEQTRLEVELVDFNDILMVDIIDIYRHLPQKLIKFHQRMNDRYEYMYILKTDDDSYIDVEAISVSLFEARRVTLDKTWFGCFRNDWPVERHGKWSERTYSAAIYPRFACGSGNVMSYDVSGWLSQNRQHLHMYQGEDVSMGIWLSAIGPRFIQDDRWKCNKECQPDMFSMPDLSPAEMETLWKNKHDCGNPCHCSRGTTNTL